MFLFFSACSQAPLANESEVLIKPNKIATAWLSLRDWDEGVASISDNHEVIESVSPSWFLTDSSGFVLPRAESNFNNPNLKVIALSNTFNLFPLIMNVTPGGAQIGLIRPVLQNDYLRNIHLRALLKIVKDNDYHGLSLDYESLTATDLSNLVILVKELADSLHSMSKSLIVNLECIGESGAPHWRNIGIYSDAVVILAYGKRRDIPSPLPPEWINECLTRAVNNIPAMKLIQGIPLFGESWKNGSSTTNTWKFFNKILLDNPHISVQRDESTMTPWFSTEKDTVWYEDALSADKKMEIGWQLGIRKFAFWRLGGEDPEVWSVIKKYALR